MNAPVTFRNHAPECCPMCGAPARPKMLVAHIQAVVAAYFGINVNYMWSAQRGQDIVRPRQIAMFLSRELTPMSLPQIGKRFRRDHTTVIYSIAAVQERILDDLELLEDLNILRERLSVERDADAEIARDVQEAVQRVFPQAVAA